MNRPWLIWIAFALCFFAVLGAMGWVSVTVLRLEHAEINAQQHAEREENVRLALWRMDSALSPMIATENARPYFAYRSFYPLERAFGNMLNKLNGSEILMPSPLLTQNSPYVQLHFQLNPDGTISSPQVPGKEAALAAGYAPREKLDAAAAKLAELNKFLNRDELLSVLPREELSQAVPVQPQVATNDSAVQQPALQQFEPEQKTVPPFNLNYVDPEQNEIKKPQLDNNSNSFGNRGKGQASQALKNVAERNFRSSAYQQMASQEKEAQNAWSANAPMPQSNEVAQRRTPQAPLQTGSIAPMAKTDNPVCKSDLQSKGAGKPGLNFVPMRPTQNLLVVPGSDSQNAPAEVAEGVSIPIWFGDSLLLARRCSVKKDLYIQGCWLDWTAIKTSLLADIQDLLPNANLVADPSPPIPSARNERGDTSDGAAYMLAAIPVRLIPGALTVEDVPYWSPIRLSLFVAWICVLLAAAAVAALLTGLLSLSERRGAFVSAVTHELRTPLTTFRMYTEMLATGMVPDEQKRQGYLNTLRVEAERLSHLVENVLAYAKLERGPSQSRLQTITLKDLLDKVSSRMTERALQAGMELMVLSDDSSLQFEARTDPSAVEQILFNLVDNACKYAASAANPKICILAGSDSTRVFLKVCDYGHGFSEKEVRNLFKPFSKSAKEAAHSAPGVGLGLALSRRLARDMGGDLKLDRSAAQGACFVLTLPTPN